jgi:undecaprenyl phosphate-alpha-L-ara4N flippase subunit ArnE
MTPFFAAVIAVCILSSVGGQVFFKKAMGQTNTGTLRKGRFASLLACGIAMMALNFLLWQGLLSKFDLNFLYPFEGLDRLVLVAAAAVFLKEKMTLTLWVGVLMITAGILLVSMS